VKAVFFKSTITVEIHRIDENGKIQIDSVLRSMEQGEVVEVSEYEEGSLMIFADGSIWWTPDKNLFNIVGVGSPTQSCCGG
jgi:cytidylate kinase